MIHVPELQDTYYLVAIVHVWSPHRVWVYVVLRPGWWCSMWPTATTRGWLWEADMPGHTHCVWDTSPSHACSTYSNTQIARSYLIFKRWVLWSIKVACLCMMDSESLVFRSTSVSAFTMIMISHDIQNCPCTMWQIHISSNMKFISFYNWSLYLSYVHLSYVHLS